MPKAKLKKRPTRGRPRVARPRDYTLHIRLDDVERDAYARAAREAKLSVSDYVRVAVTQIMMRGAGES